MMNIKEKIVNTALMESPSHNSHPEAEPIRSYGGNSLAFLGLFPQTLHFLTPDGVVNYRLVNKVAVVLGDPVCAPEAIEKVTQSFLDFCARTHWHVAFYQASSAYLSAYHALGLHSFKMGEEALLNPQTFTLRGSALANVRTSARRAEREGVSVQWFEGVPPTAVMQQLEDVSRIWLEHKAGKQPSETGFSTGKLDDVIEGALLAEDVASLSLSASPGNAPRFVTAVVTTSTGAACAFVTFTPIYAAPMGEGIQSETRGWGWSIDLMRRTPDAPPGVMELVLVRALERFRSSGAQVVNLGLVALVDTCQEMTSVQRHLVSAVFNHLHLLEGRESLFKFKQKFHPCWQSRYLVTSSTLALPQIALAILHLRNYSGGGVARLMSDSAKREEQVGSKRKREEWSLKEMKEKRSLEATSTKKTRRVWRGTFWQFLCFCLVGGTNTAIDLLTLNILLWSFPTTNAQVLVIYNSFAYCAGALTSFFLNKHWTFRHRQRTTGKVVLRFAILLACEILYSNILVWLAGKMLHPLISNPILWGNASKLLAVAGSAVLSYAGMRFWAFAGHSQDLPQQEVKAKRS